MKESAFMKHALREIIAAPTARANELAERLWPEHRQLNRYNRRGQYGQNLNRAAAGYRARLEKHGYIGSKYHPLREEWVYYATEKGRAVLDQDS